MPSRSIPGRRYCFRALGVGLPLAEGLAVTIAAEHVPRRVARQRNGVAQPCPAVAKYGTGCISGMREEPAEESPLGLGGFRWWLPPLLRLRLGGFRRRRSLARGRLRAVCESELPLQRTKENVR